MSGTCETCKNAETCKKAIGHIFGFCNTEYTPKEEGERDDHQRPKRRGDDE